MARRFSPPEFTRKTLCSNRREWATTVFFAGALVGLIIPLQSAMSRRYRLRTSRNLQFSRVPNLGTLLHSRHYSNNPVGPPAEIFGRGPKSDRRPDVHAPFRAAVS